MIAFLLTQIAKLKASIIKAHGIQKSKNGVAMTTTLSYTGLSVTIPAHCAFVVSARAGYINGEPQEVAICNSDTIATANLATGVKSGVIASTTFAWYTDTDPLTLYIWARYNNESNNNVHCTGFYVEMT